MSAPIARMGSISSPPVKADKRGQRMIRTPTIPMATAVRRTLRTVSPRISAARTTTKSGMAYWIAFTSYNGRIASPAKLIAIAVVPINPRQRWPMGLLVLRPERKSPRTASQPTITGKAKSERKNTVWPGGTSAAAALMNDAMTTNSKTDATLRAIAR